MKKNGINRREFVGTLAASAVALHPALSAAKEPEPKSGMKVGLYSITYLGIWYNGAGLPMDEVIQRAKKYGYDGVEFDGKRPHGDPLDKHPPGEFFGVLLGELPGEVGAYHDLHTRCLDELQFRVERVQELRRAVRCEDLERMGLEREGDARIPPRPAGHAELRGRRRAALRLLTRDPSTRRSP